MNIHLARQVKYL